MNAMRVLKLCLLGSAAMTCPTSLMAQTSAATSVAAAQAPAETGAQDNQQPSNRDIVVTGFRKSYADALRMKRNDLGVVDGISSDGLGRFPDLNVGEALQRVPGVQINREAGSRDATINLRGLPGTYARYTINGQSFADPVLDGSTPLGAFNSDVFSAIAVRKTISAKDQAGGMSGIIDLQIAPALGRKDGGFFKLAAEYDDLGSYKTPQITAGYNKHITDNFAVFGVVAYKREKFRRDLIYFNAYTPLSPTTTPNFASYADYYAPTMPTAPAAPAMSARQPVPAPRAPKACFSHPMSASSSNTMKARC
jgi:TonB-dependent receptor